MIEAMHVNTIPDSNKDQNSGSSEKGKLIKTKSLSQDECNVVLKAFVERMIHLRNCMDVYIYIYNLYVLQAPHSVCMTQPAKNVQDKQ